MMDDWTPDAILGLTLHHLGNEVDELTRLTKSQALSEEDREEVRRVIETLSALVETVTQREAA